MEQEYLSYRREGVGPNSAAIKVGVRPRAMAAYIEGNLEFAMKVDEALAERIEAVEEQAWAAATRTTTDEDGFEIKAGEPWAIKMVLESHLPDTWSRPDREAILRIGAAADDIDINELHKRLALASGKDDSAEEKD